MTPLSYQFRRMERGAQQAAIRRLAAVGLTDHDIAELLELHPEEVKRAIGNQDEERGDA